MKEMEENILTIKKYFDLGTFVIPNFQRGYKWGVPNKTEKESCAVSILLDNLLVAQKKDLTEYFIQGVTVYEEENYPNKKIVLIDGQQRTTTFFLLLKYLDYQSLPAINYEIREESDYFLKQSIIKNGRLEFHDELNKKYDLQDIYYFKKAINTIHGKLKNKSSQAKDDFLEFILDKVNLFYVKIAPEKATNVFSMMNGQKAVMEDEELIKASILSKVSESISNEISENEEWEINSRRSQYAREWDKWMYWWNREEVRAFYNSKNPLGLLLECYFDLHAPKKTYSYKKFDELFLQNANDTRNHFKEIRSLQKTFEDWFNDYEIYNYLGLIFKKKGTIKKDVIKHLRVLDKSDFKNKLKEYAKWVIVGVSHNDIISIDESSTIERNLKVDIALRGLSSQAVYQNDYHDLALNQLLRKNVELDNALGRKFDFAIYGAKSLEHIRPKSWEDNEDTRLKFADKHKTTHSIHCIGNLMLLDNKTNSVLSASDFDEKKARFFDITNVKWSLRLLHSVSVFSQSKWDEQSIIDNKLAFLNDFKKYYNL